MVWISPKLENTLSMDAELDGIFRIFCARLHKSLLTGEADSVLLGVLVFGAGSGSRSAKGRFAGLAADGHFSL